MFIGTGRSSSGTVHSYSISTIQIIGATLSQISLTWSLTLGSNLPKVYYYINYPGITTTGNTPIAALPLGTSNTPAGVGFTEVTPGLIINVTLNDYITFATYSSAGYSIGELDFAFGNIYDAGSTTVIGTFDIKIIDT